MAPATRPVTTTPSSRTARSGSRTTPTWCVTSSGGRRCAATSWRTGSWTSPPSATVSPATSPGRSSAPATAPSGARLQQVTEPGDRVAILCPQGLDYVVAFFGAHVRRPHRGAAVRPGRAGPRRPAARGARRLHPVGDPDHQRLRRGRAQVLPQPPGQRAAARHRRRRDARRGRRHLGAARDRPGRHRLPAVHLRLHPHPDRRGDHPPEPAHQRGADAGRARGPTKATAASPGCRCSTTWA